MRAVVMAGGEGTRLRPLTSNQPKPMVSLCGKPCMEYIMELLAAHGFREAVVTLMFMPKAIRDYFGDGSPIDMDLDYSIELTPAGTAGSVKLAEDRLGDDTFVVISGDALTDFDLSEIVRFHKQRGAMATIALKRVEDPLDFGVVVVDDEGHIERFLEKPTWGQVFSDTVNTGIYVLDPAVFEYIPSERPYDFSRDLFPKLFDMGAPLYGCVAEGYWQDIGSLPQYRAANRDHHDGTVSAAIPGVELQNRIFLGDGINLDSLENMTGPAFVGNYSRIDASASVGAYSVLGSNVVVKDHAETRHSIIGANSYLGASAKVHGAVLGRRCDVKAGARLSEGVTVGDQCVIGEEAYIAPDVKIYPFKTVDAGAQINSSIIWESRGTSRLFGKEGVSGLTNVDITAELALNLAMAYGTMLPKGARVTTSRDAHPASRVIKRALISGLNSTGVSVRDLRVAGSAVNRFHVKRGETQGGMHVRITSWDPESIQIQVFEPPGANLSERRQKDIERLYGRQDFRRAYCSEFGDVQFSDGAMETYVRGLMGTWDMERIRSRVYRVVVDYSHSPASLSLPHILGDMDAEVLALRAFTAQRHADRASGDLDASIGDVQRLVLTMEADLGFVIDPGAERLHIIDEKGVEVPFEKALLLYVRLAAQKAAPGERILLPLTVTDRAELLAAESGVEVVRTKTSMSALARAACEDHVAFAGALGGGYIFPRFLPAFDAVMSLGKLLEMLAPEGRPL
ncbi:MAG TPA: sugar phosphate nucleotidyltransferase, partial [Dehalococcoidia bacterium]|nr:sugar phosphate nucleotidyltransferase [Dehalococcoidia bacterium]